MWALDNQTPFAAERTWVRDREGAEVWLVAVKGTFKISSDGNTSICEKQEDVHLAPKYIGEPTGSSLLYDSDLPYTKLTTDVILNGHAYATPGNPVKALEVSLRVADLIKILHIMGDRYWKRGLLGIRLGTPIPFLKMPITYERAFGGTDNRSKDPKKHTWDPRNPIGTGVAARRSHLVGQRAPNVHLPGLGARLGFHKRRPAGFGAIPGHWLPRAKLAGTCDAKWEAERAPLLPEDFDDLFYQSAPKDQQTNQFLKGGEMVELKNLTPGGQLAFKLPRVILGFETEVGAERVSHRANLHTVILEPDVPRVLMVWHTSMPCHSKGTKLKRTRIFEKTLLSRPAESPNENELEIEPG